MLSKILLSSAVTLSLYSSNIELKTGWNLLGSNYDDINVSSTFKNASSVWKYNGGWEAVSPNTTLNDTLKSANLLNSSMGIDAGQGYWVNNTLDENITLIGNIPSSTILDINSSGWHLISLRSNNDVNVSSTFDIDNINTIWKYGSSGWMAYSPDEDMKATLKNASISALDTIKATDGFWINAVGAFNVNTEVETQAKLNKLVVFENIENTIVPLSNVDVLKDGTVVGKTNLFGAIDLDVGGVYTLKKDKYISTTKVISTKDIYDNLVLESNSTVDINGTIFDINEKSELIDIGNWNIKPQNTFVAAAPIPKVFISGDGNIYVIVYEMSSISGNDLTMSIVNTTITALDNVVASFDMQLETSNGTTTTASEQGLTLEFKPMVKGDFNSTFDYVMYQFDDNNWKLLSKVDLVNGKLRAKIKVDKVTQYAFVKVPRIEDKTVCIKDSADKTLDGTLITEYGTLLENNIDGCFEVSVLDNNTSAQIYADGYETKNIVLDGDKDIEFTTNLETFLGVDLQILHDEGTHINYASIQKIGINYIIPKTPKRFGVYDGDLTLQYEINATDTVFDAIYTSENNNSIYSGSFVGEVYEHNSTSKTKQVNIVDDLWGEGEFVYKPINFDNHLYLPTAANSLIYFDNQFKILDLDAEENLTKDTVNEPIVDVVNDKLFVSNYGGKIWYVENIDELSTAYDTNGLVSNKAMMLSNNSIFVGSGTKVLKLDTNLTQEYDISIYDRTYFIKEFTNKIYSAGENMIHIINSDLSAKLSCDLSGTHSVGMVNYNSKIFIFESNGMVYKIDGTEQTCDDINSFKLNRGVSSSSTVDNMLQINLENGQVLIGKGE